MRSQIGSLVQRQKDAELHLDKVQRDYIDIEIRKYRRRKLLQYHTLEQELLREVGLVYNAELSLDVKLILVQLYLGIFFLNLKHPLSHFYDTCYMACLFILSVACNAV